MLSIYIPPRKTIRLGTTDFPISGIGAWTPATLFADGQQGVWYEAKPEYLYQDAAGTVPVTADGDPVGLMLDRSGNVLHATQSTASLKPIYRTNGVLHWLDGDGIDDTMASPPAPRLPSNGTGMSLVMASRRSDNGSSIRLSQYNTSNNRRGFGTNIISSSSTNYIFSVQKADVFNSNLNVTIPCPIERHVFTGAWAGAGSANQARIDGGDWVFSSGVLEDSGTSADQPIELFSVNNGGIVSSGVFYGGVVIREFLSDEQFENNKSYFAELAGVTL